MTYPYVDPSALAATDDGAVYVASAVVRVGNTAFQSGVARTADGGQTWQDVEITSDNVLVYDFGAVGANRVLANTSSGLYVNEGEGSWKPIQLPGVPPATRLDVLATDPSGMVATSFQGAVLTSADRGQSWTRVVPEEAGRIPRAVSSEGVLFQWGAPPEIVSISTDDGATWTEEYVSSDAVLRVYAAPSSGETYAGTKGGLYRRDPEGTGWTLAGLSDLPSTDILQGGDELFVATRNGFYRAAIGGGTTDWVPSNGGLNHAWISELAAGDEGTVYVGEFTGRVSTLTDDGAEWTEIGRFEYVTALDVGPDGTVFVGSGPNADPLWRRETDGTWTPLPLPVFVVFALYVTDSSTVLAGHDEGISLSEDRGDTWETVTVLGAFGTNDLVKDEASETLYAGGGGVSRSLDGGRSWEFVGIPGESVRAVWARGDVLLAGIYGIGEPDRVMRSADGGDTWQTVLQVGGPPAEFATRVGEVYVAVSTEVAGRQLYRSVDEGATWEAFTEGLPEVPSGPGANALVASGGHLFVGTTSRGVHRTVSPVVGVQEDTPTVDALKVRSFPNPFTSMVTFSLAVRERGSVRVALYDLLGRKVSEYTEGPVPSGRQSIRLDVSDLRPGVYVARLTATGAGGQVEERSLKIAKVE